MTIFQAGNRVSDDKNECNLFHGKWGTEYSFEIFSLKTPYTGWMKIKKPVLGHIFLVSVVLLDRLYQKKKKNVHLCVESQHLCEFHKNWFKTATCIVTIIIIINWKSRSVFFNVSWRTSTRFCCSKVYSVERKFYGEWSSFLSNFR